jgi:hypothetical protein
LALIQQKAPFARSAQFFGEDIDFLCALGAIGLLEGKDPDVRGTVHISEI